jgi:GT2 family glycosyltransferase
MLLNVDVAFDKDFLKTLVKYIETSKDIAMVCPISFDHKEQLVYYYDFFYKQKKSASITYTGNNVIVNAKYHPKTNKLIEIFYHGVFLAKTELIGKHIFDEDYYMYCEDMHLCWRLKAEGYKVYITLETFYWHSSGHSKQASKEVNIKASFHGTKNKVMTLMIYYNYWTLIRLIPLIFISELIYLCYEPRKILIKLKAYLWIVLNIGKIHKKHKEVKHRLNNKEFSYKIYDKFYLFPLNWIAKLYCWIIFP